MIEFDEAHDTECFENKGVRGFTIPKGITKYRVKYWDRVETKTKDINETAFEEIINEYPEIHVID